MTSKMPKPRSIPAMRWISLCLALDCAGAMAQQTADVEALEAAVQRGDARALVTLAVKYERGDSVSRDFIKSNELYCKAAASGLPGYESTSPFGFFAPGKTPRTIVDRLNQATVRVLNQPSVREKFLGAGVEPIGSTSQQLLMTVKSEMAKWGKVIRDAGIKQQ